MADNETKAKSRAIEELLVPIRSELDQLGKKAEDEGINVERATTEALLKQLTDLHLLEREARETRNTRTIAAVTKERDRAREGLGLTPRRRR